MQIVPLGTFDIVPTFTNFLILPQVIHYSLPESLEEYVQVNYSHLYLVITASLPQLVQLKHEFDVKLLE